jgi:hypothetical protein
MSFSSVFKINQHMRAAMCICSPTLFNTVGSKENGLVL